MGKKLRGHRKLNSLETPSVPTINLCVANLEALFITYALLTGTAVLLDSRNRYRRVLCGYFITDYKLGK